MPFHRIENKEMIIKHLSQFDVVFHPITNEPTKFPRLGWIKPFTFASPPANIAWVYYYALNKFIEKAKIIDNDYYMFLSDDDFLEPGFFKKLKGIKSDFIVVSMNRGDNAPPGSEGGPGLLICSWRVMGRRGMGGEQLIVKGKHLKNEKFLDIRIADKKFAGKLWNTNPHQNFTFVPNAYIWFNYLEPGRWNEAKKTLKS
ncbi:hypothetical protein HYT60_00485 [Candidatus Woesebacteria bacterium]|nr:hypothetical protein [Candidatus Woesebacteria bacterium]